MKTMILASTALAFGVLAGAAHAAPTVLNGEGSSLATPTYNNEFTVYNPTNSAYNLNEYSTSSGKGQAALLNNTGTASSGVPAGLPVYWAASDSYIASTYLSSFQTTATPAAGALIQVPMIGTPITVPYKNNIVSAVTPQNPQGGASLVLSDADLCGVFSGKITDWSKTAGGKAQKATGPITVNYRTDGSGTSFLFTQHLVAVCTAAQDGGVFSSHKVAAPLSSANPPYASSTFASFFTTVPANFVGNSGSAAVAAAISGQTSAIGYLSPDFTGIASAPAVTYELPVASVTNATAKKSFQPTIGATQTALAAPGAYSINGAPPANATDAANQLNWVPALPTPTNGYPIVGLTNWLLPTCFKTKAVGTTINAFLTNHFSGKYNAKIAAGGFTVDSPASYTAAIKADFLSNTSGFNLNINNTTACAGHTGR